MNNYKLSNEFITNESITFILQLFIIFITKLKINNKLSTTFHFQINK